MELPVCFLAKWHKSVGKSWGNIRQRMLPRNWEGVLVVSTTGLFPLAALAGCPARTISETFLFEMIFLLADFAHCISVNAIVSFIVYFARAQIG
jgi:hypothetical protein